MFGVESDIQRELVALETKLSYIEDFVNKLQEVTVEHTEQIELLKRENKMLSEKLRDISDIVEGDIPNKKPPHY